MPDPIRIDHVGLHLLISFDDQGHPLLTGLGALPAEAVPNAGGAWALAQIQGEQAEHHWNFHAMRGGRRGMALPGTDLVHQRHAWEEHGGARALRLVSTRGDLRVTTILEFPADAPVCRIRHDLENTGTAPILIEDVPALAWRGAAAGGRLPWDERFRLLRCDNGWFNELRWQELTPSQAGIVHAHLGMGACDAYCVSNVGSWSTKEHLPQGALIDRELGTCLAWQIEHTGGWAWELADDGSGCLLLVAGGPNQRLHQWSRELRPGETFRGVPVAVAAVRGGYEEAFGALTTYRRATRRRFADNEELPVIFNDYMNCLFGDPTTEKELPMIAAAAAVGCEYYVIDAGWYADAGRSWWDTIGLWEVGQGRFPDGLPDLLQRIRAAGMVPGLWLELEAMGVHCPLAAQAPDSWFFQRKGRRLVLGGRFQLDYRHPDVRAHADAVVDRLVGWGCGYIKMDYNIDSGPGTDHDADSLGDGALRHQRAYWAWLDAVYDRHPGLVVENCSSGGLRMDWGQLQRHALQSTSDQEDWRLSATIAAAAASAAPPEQQAVWCYPKRDGDREETIGNLVNALLLRIHQSGHLADLDPARRQLVADGIAVYKRLRARIPKALPRWPWGLPAWAAPRTATALEDGAGLLVAVWRMGDERRWHEVPFPAHAGRAARVECLFPAGEAQAAWHASSGKLVVEIPPTFGARLFALTWER